MVFGVGYLSHKWVEVVHEVVSDNIAISIEVATVIEIIFSKLKNIWFLVYLFIVEFLKVYISLLIKFS
jgi:hypothetical protein